MTRGIRHEDQDYTLGNVGSAYETGYRVSRVDAEGRTRTVQFQVLLDSSMRLVALADRISGPVSSADIAAAREIVTAELASNPTVFHIVQNVGYETRRLRSAVEQAKGLRRVPDTDPLVVATLSRIAALEEIVREAREWAQKPDRGPFRDFMSARELPGRDRSFDVGTMIAPGDDFRYSAPVGPIELMEAMVRAKAEAASIVVLSEASMLTRVPDAVGERHRFDWPRVSFETDSGREIMHAHAFHFLRGDPELSAKLEQDAVVLGWTPQTEPAACEQILDRLSAYGGDPRLVLGTPDGVFSGRVSAIRNALFPAPVSTPERSPAV